MRTSTCVLMASSLIAGLGLAATACIAADADATAPTPQASASVTSYPASFFAPMGLNTAYDMVLRVPGFAFDDGSAVRGFAGAVGNVLIDGRPPASKTDDLKQLLLRLPAGQVERIDLIRGGAPGVDMQGKTVVANVIRKQARGFTGDVQPGFYKPERLPVDPQLRLEGAWRDGVRLFEASVFLGTYHDLSYTPGPHDVYAPHGPLIDYSHAEYTAPNSNMIGVFSYETPLAGGRLQAKLTLQDQPYYLKALDRFQHAGPEALHSPQDVTDGELGLHYDRDLTQHLSLEVVGLQHVNRTGFKSRFDTDSDAQVFDLRESGGEDIGRLILHWRPIAAVTVDGGGEFAYNWLRTHTVFTDNGSPIPLPAANVLVQESRGEAFENTTWRATPKLTLEAGVRVESSTLTSSGDLSLAKTLVYPKPRVVLTWTPDAADQGRLRVEREVGQLDFKYFAAAASLNGPGVFPGNPSLQPQTDWAIEAAWDRKFWKYGLLSVTLRQLQIQDAIDQVPVVNSAGVFSEAGNIGAGKETDVLATFTLPLDRLFVPHGTLRGQSTWRISQVTDPTTGQRRPISGQHPNDAELHFTQDLLRGRLTWGVDSWLISRQSNYYITEIDRFKQGTYSNLFVEYKPRRDLSIRLSLDNFERPDSTLQREVYGGPRNASSLAVVDVQEHRQGDYAFFRVRKDFGGP